MHVVQNRALFYVHFNKPQVLAGVAANAANVSDTVASLLHRIFHTHPLGVLLL